MEVVNKHKDLKLKKKEGGVYIITQDEEPKRKIITGDYSSRDKVYEKYEFSGPIDEVHSFSEVKSIFELESKAQKSILDSIGTKNKVKIMVTFFILFYIIYNQLIFQGLLILIMILISRYVYITYSNFDFSKTSLDEKVKRQTR